MLVGDMADLLQKYYSQVKNPNPVFTPREGAGTLKFCEKLMEKAVGFTSRFDFAIHVAHARSKGLRRRMPPVSTFNCNGLPHKVTTVHLIKRHPPALQGAMYLLNTCLYLL